MKTRLIIFAVLLAISGLAAIGIINRIKKDMQVRRVAVESLETC